MRECGHNEGNDGRPPWTHFVLDEELYFRYGSSGGEVWRNSRYFVEVTRLPVETSSEPAIHLHIRSNDGRPIHNWRDLQRIKDEVLGEEVEAFEMYPAKSRLVDDANAYHLWSVPVDDLLRCLLGWSVA
jgi:hypothetical protein